MKKLFYLIGFLTLTLPAKLLAQDGLTSFNHQAVVRNTDGTITHIVGRGSSVTGTFTAIDFSSADLYLKVGIDLNGGNSFQPPGAAAGVSALANNTTGVENTAVGGLIALAVGTTPSNGNWAYLTAGGIWTNTSDRNT
ncbi:MAG TPA: hypothetical protein VIR29_05100 [Anseongella sp.]